MSAPYTITHRVIIDDKGMIRCLHNNALPLHELGTLTTTRLSTITPIGSFKLAAFRLLRWLFGERGRVAEFTRKWKGPWYVEIIATGEWSVFLKRSDAVAWEIERINSNPARFDL